MLPTSVRRVVQTAPQTGLTASLASAAPKATTPYLGRCHQRRYSSSSSSKPSNGANQDAPAEQPQAAQAPSARGRKRKAKAPTEADAWTKNLPSVPNTAHMTTGALSLTSFFSLHRPISITEPMPKAMSNEHFASIFAQPTKSKNAQDTISTLSNTIDQLEGPMAQLTVDNQEVQNNGEVTHTLEYRHPDGTETNIHVRVDAMSGEFFPFRPPPAPQPNAAAADNISAMQHGTLDESSSHRVYKAVFTIEETTEADGQVRILAHSPRVVDVPPRSFLERLAQRQLKFDEAQGVRGMHAISVRRQRKLRMKKKKYKKLMRRTRNLRRKLDRT